MIPRSYEECTRSLVSPDRLYRCAEVLDSFEDRSIRGVYACWFKEMPASIPLEGMRRSGEMALLYVGSSKRPLRKRLGEHVRDDASRSTLRRSIGCLLAERLRIELEVSRVSRMTHCHFGFGLAGERTDRSKLRALAARPDSEIDTSDIPEMTEHNGRTRGAATSIAPASAR